MVAMLFCFFTKQAVFKVHSALSANAQSLGPLVVEGEIQPRPGHTGCIQIDKKECCPVPVPAPRF